MIEDKFTPPSQALTRRLRSLIADLDQNSVVSTAKQVCGWIRPSKDHDDRFRGLLRLAAELVLGKAMERPDQDFHVLGRFCKIIDTTTDGEYSGFLNSLWEKEIQAAGVELLANDKAEPGSWPECLALVVFAGRLYDDRLLEPDALRSCARMLGGLKSNLGLELACTLLETTGSTLCEDPNGKTCFDTAIRTMLTTSREDGVYMHLRLRVQELAAQGVSRRAPRKSSDDVQWDDETVNLDASEHPAEQDIFQVCKPKHSKLYFRSGDVVFVCEDTSFRVQSDLLSYNSQVFSEMLARSRLNGEHLSDGCPCVHLSDNAEDFAALLMVFYTPGYLHRRKTPDFATFASLLRMTTKYQFQVIRSQVLLDLLPAYPTQLSDYEGSSDLGEEVFKSPRPHPNSVLNLLLACGVTFALPFAYYRVCIAGDPASLDTSTEEIALPLDTLKTALRGQQRLKTDEVQLSKKVALRGCDRWKCTGKYVSSRVEVFNWIHPEVKQGGILERGGFDGSGFCPQCLEGFKSELSTAKKDTWENLPSYFGLSSWNTTLKPLL